MFVHQLLIVGPYPPPIGGVTVHVQRLLQQLDLFAVDYSFVDIKRSSLATIFYKILIHKTIHLHTSHSYLRFLITCFCFLSFKKLIFTFHGDVGRYGWFRNWIDQCSIKLATIPIVLNDSSLKKAKKINKNTKKVSAFIPPLAIEELKSKTKEDILNLKKRGLKRIFCTNAYNVSYDKEGNEIYQILKLIDIFNDQPKIGLIISDPSGQYLSLLKDLNQKINNNILLINYPHDFNAIIKESDGFIRFTTTDGDSLSIKEALLLGKVVIATNVVERPKEVRVIPNDRDSLLNALTNFNVNSQGLFDENGFKQLLEVYNSINK